MSLEKPKNYDIVAEDFRDLNFLRQVMIGGDSVQLSRMRKFLLANGLTARQIDISIKLQKLRSQIHDQLKEDTKHRANNNPLPTSEELALGAYKEMLEPQVREAIFLMRKKGYDTVSSGFSDFNFQTISFAENLIFEQKIIEDLNKLGVKARGKMLVFECDKDDLVLIKEKWDKIAEILPDHGKIAPESPTTIAKTFRRLNEENKLKEWFGG